MKANNINVQAEPSAGDIIRVRRAEYDELVEKAQKYEANVAKNAKGGKSRWEGVSKADRSKAMTEIARKKAQK